MVRCGRFDPAMAVEDLLHTVEEPSPEGGCWAETAPHAICLAALKAVE